jgi:hypothetical protein
MAITKPYARQCEEVATCNFTYADLTSGTYAACIDLPLNAIVTGGYVAVTTLFDSATTDKFSIGDKIGSASATATTYASQSADITATGLAASVVPTGSKYTSAATVGVVWTGAGTAPSAGEGVLVIKYIIDGRAESVFEA